MSIELKKQPSIDTMDRKRNSNVRSRSYERLGLIFSFGWLVRGLLGLRDCEVDWT